MNDAPLKEIRIDPISRLIQSLAKLPSIGEKTATRLAFHIIRSGRSKAMELSQALIDATERVRLCSRCMNFTDGELCSICSDPRRDASTICVVESVQDVRAIERGKDYRGLYHILHGTIQPLQGIQPDDLKIKELLMRLKSKAEPVNEIILAVDPSVEGEVTALYLLRMLSPLGLKVSRIATGIPIGQDLEYADPATIAKALSGRTLMA